MGRWFVLVLAFAILVGAEKRAEKRCICLCKADDDLDTPKTPYINSTNVNKSTDCDCEGTVGPHIAQKIIDHGNTTGMLLKYCKGCDCQFETRSLAVIDFSMYLYIIGLAVLVIYYFLTSSNLIPDSWQNSLQGQSSRASLARGHDNLGGIPENDTAGLASNDALSRQTSTRSHSASHENDNVIRRISRVTNAWKEEVKHQREAVFDRREVLH